MAGKNYDRRNGLSNSVTAAICLTLFIFALSVVLILNARWLYYLDITLLSLEKGSGMDAAAIKANYDALISYNLLWHRGPLVFPTLPMSATAEIHFREVKRIFDAVQVICIVTGILSVVLGVRARRKGRRSLRLTGILTLVIPAVLGILAAISWEQFFITFHHLFFRNDYWLFDPATDPVILILPDTYFLHCAAGILLLIVLGSVLCFAFSGREERRLRGKRR